MTHEELKEHKGTVWSYAGFIGLFEYEYIGPGRLPVYGTFRRVDTKKVCEGIQTCSCFPTKRAALSEYVKGCAWRIGIITRQMNEAQAELDAMEDEE